MIPIQHLEVGRRLRLSNGGIAVVVDNPRDGMWIVIRYLEAPHDPQLAGTEEPCSADDVAEVLDAEQR